MSKNFNTKLVINNAKNIFKNNKTVMVRGEIIIPIDVYEKKYK